jgi:hypothetical protein
LTSFAAPPRKRSSASSNSGIVLAALVASVVLNLALCIPLSDRYGWFFELADLVRYKLALWHA